MQTKLKKILHEFKVRDFKIIHDRHSAEEITAECLNFTEEALNTAFRYHFHKLPDVDRAEIINMINNYVLEAILPPVVEKIVQRQLIMERRFDELLSCFEQTLEALSGSDSTPVEPGPSS